jgi:uncharacterized membrane protein YphA (DoxX/SURF4 family)
MKIFTFIICLLFGLVFIFAGIGKFYNFAGEQKDTPARMLEIFNALKTVGWVLPLVGIAEIVGGFLFIIPRTRPLAALILLPILAGILLTNLSLPYSGPMGPVILIILWAIELFVIISNRKRYLPMVQG